jgi:hypothetical protein
LLASDNLIVENSAKIFMRRFRVRPPKNHP